MIPFAAVFRGVGLRINEYGNKTLELVVGDITGPAHYALTFVQHMVISWFAALPLLLCLGLLARKRDRVLAGGVYGAGFYVVVNSLVLPLAFGDSTPWQLGFETVYPSLVVHLVYGIVVALLARSAAESSESEPALRSA